MTLVGITCVILLGAPITPVATAGGGPGPEDKQLESDLANNLAGLDAHYGIVVINLNDGRTALHHANDSFPAASMYKLLVMYRVFQAIEKGTISPNDTVTIQDGDVTQDEPDGGFSSGDTPTVSQALQAMIAISSNAAASALMRMVGGESYVESAAHELGMDNTTTVDGDFWTTPSDIAHFFQLLDNRSMINPKASEQMLDLLLQQTINDRLPAELPSEAAAAHKTGELDDTRNDGGIVYGPKGRYVIVLMSDWGTPQDEIQAEADMSRTVYAEYGQ